MLRLQAGRRIGCKRAALTRAPLAPLAEIAAGWFAATLLGLRFHPKLLDPLLLWDSDPDVAEAWAAVFDAFDPALIRKEIV